MEQRQPFAADWPLRPASGRELTSESLRSVTAVRFNERFFDANQRNISQQSVYCPDDQMTEEFMDKLVLGVTALALSAGAASAQGYGYGYGYGYAGAASLYDYAATGYGYAAPAYAAPAPATTVIIVTPSPAYTAPPVAYAPGYWGGYGWGGYGGAGYWGR